MAKRKTTRKLTIALLRSILNYDSKTGVFRWKQKTCRKVVINKMAGTTLTAQGYNIIGILGQHYLLHRVVYFWMIGKWPPDQIDTTV